MPTALPLLSTREDPNATSANDVAGHSGISVVVPIHIGANLLDVAFASALECPVIELVAPPRIARSFPNAKKST
jgi:hypothetical protein